MRFIGDIAEDAEVRAIASDAITDGASVIVNANGTVSDVIEVSEGLGSTTVFESANIRIITSTFDSNSNRVVVAYRDVGNSNYGTAVVGSVSGTSISFGTPVVYESATITANNAITFDSNSNKVVVAYEDGGNSDYGTAIVGTVDSSDNSISFGSATVFESDNLGSGGSNGGALVATFDSNSNKVVLIYRDQNNSSYGTAIVGTVSGTSISFGTAVVFNSGTTSASSVTFDSNSNKVVVAYRDESNSDNGTAIVGTVSGTGISFGSEVVFATGSIVYTSSTFDTNSNKVLISYMNSADSEKGSAIVGTVSGTSISFGTAAIFNADKTGYNQASFNSNINAHTIVFKEEDSGYSVTGKIIIATISGTNVSFGSKITFETGGSYFENSSVTFDSNANQIVIAYQDTDNSNYGTAIILQNAVPTNLTTENYIGIANAAYADGQKATVKTTGSIARNVPQQPLPQALGTAVVFNEADTTDGNSVFDPDTNKIIWAGRDEGNSNYGTAIVATIDPSDNSVSFGSKVVFNSAASSETDITYDTNSNKVVIAWANGTSNAQAIVGTVSGTSISFGSAETFNARTSKLGIAFDSNSNKVVIAYEDSSNSKHGTAIVGTVSSTSISFGSESVFESAETGEMDIAFDSNVNKMLIVYKDSDNSSHGTAIVGTVSGTSISYGSAAVFHAAATDSFNKGTVFDTNSNKFVITYNDSSSGSDVGTAKVATISGTSVSFGSASVVPTAKSPFNNSFDSTNNKIILSYKDTNSKGSTCIGTISGTSISFGSAVVFENSTTTTPKGNAYDSNSKRALFTFQDGANSGHGTGIVLSPAQNGNLTIGQQYFVQTDGSLGTSADDPSVIAGTAIGTSELIVKG